jgi:preprotein translocase subunit SecF
LSAISVLRRLYNGETRIDFIGKRKIWFAISTAMIIVSLVSLYAKGLNYGIEFEGGVSIQAPVESAEFDDASDQDIVQAVNDALADINVEGAQVQVATDDDGRSVLVQTKEVADAEAQATLVGSVSESVGASLENTDSSRVGSQWGGEITDKAVRALIIFMIVIMAFISWRFEWKMAVSAIVALVHDLLITAGIYSLVGFEVTPSSVIAILTILGYSLYDTVVVFDKVEEDASLYAMTGRMTYQDAANMAMNEVFMRSLNTSLATLLPVGALLFVGAGLLGATTMKDLALALLVGIIAGAYSSIFLATPLLVMMKEREPRYRNVREKILRGSQRAEAGASVPAAAAAIEASEPAAGSATVAPAAGRPAARPRAGSKKAKRRKKR